MIDPCESFKYTAETLEEWQILSWAELELLQIGPTLSHNKDTGFIGVFEFIWAFTNTIGGIIWPRRNTNIFGIQKEPAIRIQWAQEITIKELLRRHHLFDKFGKLSVAAVRLALALECGTEPAAICSTSDETAATLLALCQSP